MLHPHPRLPHTSENVAEFLADREGLVGGARERFSRLLDQYGGFQNDSDARRTRLAFFVSLFLGLVGLLSDRPQQGNDVWVWITYGLFSAGLIWGFRADETKLRHLDRETNWEAYCLFLRPIILSDHPGLLDKNAVHPRETPGQPPHPIPVLRSLVHQRGPDFWWTALVGLWGGTGTLVIVHQTIGATHWVESLAFPVGGVILGLATWLLWRQLAYLFMKSDSRLTGL